MKLSTLIIIALLGLITWPKIKEFAEWRPNDMAPVPQTVPATPAPAATVPRGPATCAPSDLAVVHGVVASVRDGRLMIDCVPNDGGGVGGLTFGGGVKGAETAIAIMAKQEAKMYGPILRANQGQLGATETAPAHRPLGQVELSGYPGADGLVIGARVNVLAAPLGAASGVDRYTANFRIAGGAPQYDRYGRRVIEIEAR